MAGQRFALTAFTILALVSGSLLLAREEEKKPADKGSDRLEALAKKLNLSDQQKQQVKQLDTDFDKKGAPLLQQLCTQGHDKWLAVRNVFTEEQRAKLPEVLKTQAAKELQSVVQKLNLSDEQKQRVVKIREAFWKKFLNLDAKKGEKSCREYRELCMDTFAAAREVLTPEQLSKLPGMQSQDFHEGHDFALRHDHLKAIADQLGLSDEQRNQIQKLCASSEKKMDQPRAQFRQLCKEHCVAAAKVLNADQLAKLEELFPFKCLHEHPPGEEKKKE